MALTDGLLAYYKLDESSGNATDATGNGYTLTNNGTSAYVAGLIGNAIDFGSSNTTKSLTSTHNLGINGGNITIAGWVKLNTGEINDGTVVCLGSATNFVGYQIRKNSSTSNYIAARVRGGIAENSAVIGTLSTSVFTFVGLTYNGTSVKAWKNGSVQNTTNTSGNGSSGISNVVNIGVSLDSTNYKQSVICDAFGFWNRELTTDEFAELYNGGNGLQYPFTTFNPAMMHHMQIAGGLM